MLEPRFHPALTLGTHGSARSRNTPPRFRQAFRPGEAELCRDDLGDSPRPLPNPVIEVARMRPFGLTSSHRKAPSSTLA